MHGEDALLLNIMHEEARRVHEVSTACFTWLHKLQSRTRCICIGNVTHEKSRGTAKLTAEVVCQDTSPWGLLDEVGHGLQ